MLPPKIYIWSFNHQCDYICRENPWGITEVKWSYKGGALIQKALKEEVGSLSSFSLLLSVGQVRAQQEGCYLRAWKRVFTRTWPCCILFSNFKTTQSPAFCYSIWSWLIYPPFRCKFLDTQPFFLTMYPPSLNRG